MTNIKFNLHQNQQHFLEGPVFRMQDEHQTGDHFISGTRVRRTWGCEEAWGRGVGEEAEEEIHHRATESLLGWTFKPK